MSELIRAARLTLESRFADVRVEGEVSGLKRSGPGHLYFCLKDDEGSLDCVMFSREAGRLKFRVDEGMAVRCRGRLTIYEGRGKFQMTVAELEPTGAGALALAFEQLKKKLQAEGLFDVARKRPLPFLPRRLGVVSSASGAVLHDIIRVAHRRYPIADPARADAGAGRRRVDRDRQRAAPPGRGARRRRDHPRARRRLAGGPVGVQRGGASRARSSPARVPVDLGGRPRDRLHHRRLRGRRARADAVGGGGAGGAGGRRAARRADAAVPAGGARRGGPSCARAHLALERARTRLGDPRRLIDMRRQRIDELSQRALARLRRQLAARQAELRATEMRLNRAHPRRRIDAQRALLVGLRQTLEAAIKRATDRRQRALEACTHKLGALSPLRVLDRGFSLTQDAQGHLVTRADQVRPGDAITVRLREGALAAEVARRGAGPTRANPMKAALSAKCTRARRGAGRRRQPEPLAGHSPRRVSRAGRWRGSYEAHSVTARRFSRPGAIAGARGLPLRQRHDPAQERRGGDGDVALGGGARVGRGEHADLRAAKKGARAAG